MIDPLTGHSLHSREEDEPVEWLPDMAFWVHLDQDLIGARNENGFLLPSEVYAALDRWGIEDEDNRRTAKLMLDSIATGRNQAAMERIEKKEPDTKPNRRRGGRHAKRHGK